jgi:hypothetical protein
LDAARSDTPVRVWVLGCSTGEEAYSLAIALTEFSTAAGIKTPIQIFASDVNQSGIEVARQGVYPRQMIVAFAAATLAAVTGFGGAALLLPVLTLVYGVRDAIPILTVAQIDRKVNNVFLSSSWRRTAGAPPPGLEPVRPPTAVQLLEGPERREQGRRGMAGQQLPTTAPTR